MQYFKGFHSWPLVVLGGVFWAAVLAVLSWYLLEVPLSKWRKSG
jgi:peptidoglycan/LPS O-acetylase OafA/YrhL